MATDKRFTIPMKCGHCLNMTTMEITATHSSIRTHCDERSDQSWEAGQVYEILACPACEGVTLRKTFWHDSMDPSDVSYVTLYPIAEKAFRGLPPKIEKAYQSAQSVRSVDANAYGVLLGRALEFVCEDRNAIGETLDQKLKSLADIGEIPKKLVDVAAGLRKLRNIGAHAGLGELTENEVPVLDGLTRAILDYVYSAPQLAKEAEERFESLKRSTPKRDAEAVKG